MDERKPFNNCDKSLDEILADYFRASIGMNTPYDVPFWHGEVEHIKSHQRFSFNVSARDEEAAKREALNNYSRLEYKVAWIEKKGKQ